MPARRVAFVGAVAVLAALTGGPLLRIRTWWSYEDPLATDPLLVAVLALAGVVAFVAVLEDGHWRRLDRRAVAFAAALVGWLVVGTLWSLDRAETLRQALQIGAALVIGAAVALRLELTAWRWALWCGLHVGLAWSVVAIYLHRPGTLDRRGDWAGVFFNRNSLALYAALALLVGGMLAVDLIDRRGHPIRLVALVVLGGAAIVDVRLVAGSDALTPLVALLAAALAAGSAWLARARLRTDARRRAVITAAGITAVAVGVVGWSTRSSWLDDLGRRADLTGRSALWSVSLDWGWRRPFHGHGYLAAWTDPRFLADVEATRGAALSSAHNAFVDLFLGAGLVGLGLFAVLVAALYVRTALAAVTARDPIDVLPLAVLVFVVIENLTETLLVGNQLTVALLGALAVPTRRTVK